MSNWVKVTDLPIESNLAEISNYLSSRGIPHRISEDQQRQVIWCADEETASLIRAVLTAWRNGRLNIIENNNTEPATIKSQFSFIGYLRATPVTLILIIFSILGALLVYIDPELQFVRLFTFQDIFFSNGLIGFHDVTEPFDNGQIWRFWTPMFLHFSGFHILFNSLWMWELGKRVERLNGPVQYLWLILAIALCANVLQFLLGGPSIFGGMSGVVYGLVGYVWMRQKFNPHPLLAVPKGMIIFMLIWLFACIFGLVDIVTGNSVANGAHVGGLIAGMIAGVWPKRLQAK